MKQQAVIQMVLNNKTRKEAGHESVSRSLLIIMFRFGKILYRRVYVTQDSL